MKYLKWNGIRTAGALAILTLATGCFKSEEGVVAPVTQEASGDPAVDWLVSKGIKPGDIVDEGSSFLVEGDMRIQKADLLPKTGLAKSAQTYLDFDAADEIKNLNEVTDIRVYIDDAGSDAVGSNWQSGVLAAINQWNQVLGSAVRYRYWPYTTGYDIRVFAVARSTSYCAITNMQSGPLVNSAISIEINPNLESDQTLSLGGFNYDWGYMNRLTCVMHELGHVVNLWHTAEEGTGSSGGVNVHFNRVPGTPENDIGPGASASVFYGGSMYYTPYGTLTDYDQQTVRSLYPAGAVHALGSGQIHAGTGGAEVASGAVEFLYDQYEWEQPYLTWLTTSGSVMYKPLESDNYSYTMWPSGDGVADKFFYDKGYWAVKTTSGYLYTKVGSGSWINQGSGVTDFRLSGEHLVKLASDGHLYSKLLSTSPGTWTDMFSGSVTDFQVRGNVLAVSTGSELWVKIGSASWSQFYSENSDYIYDVYLSDSHVAIRLQRDGELFHVGSRPLASGTMNVEYGVVQERQFVHLCRDRLAFLSSNRLLVRDLTTGSIYSNFTKPDGSYINAMDVQLSGPNCDYISQIELNGQVWARYGINAVRPFQAYQSGAAKFAQRP